MIASARLPVGVVVGVLGVLAVGALPACSRANPLYHPGDGAGGTGTADATGTAGGPGAAGSQDASGDEGTAGTGAAGEIADGAAESIFPIDGGNPDATLGACKQPADCVAANGLPPCGAWECQAGQCAVICPQCTDADKDGFGVGPGCAGPDCDDNDPTITSSASRACYEGKAGTLGVGECHAGMQICAAGIWSSCAGQVLPSGEACNGLDDDCNGKVDDGLGTITCGLGTCTQTVAACTGGVLGVCKVGTPAVEVCGDGKDNDCDGLVDDGCAGFCVYVAPTGNDQGTGTALRPFRTIQAAIDYAAGAAGRPKNVCVAGGFTCLDTNVYQSANNATIAMANGVSVLGNYEATTWTRCPFGAQGLPIVTVTIASHAATGVTFGATVTSPTTLDGVRVARYGGGGQNATVAGITISGGQQVQISNVVIDDAVNAMTSYGVNLVSGGAALITHSAIFGGSGSAASSAVHSVGSTPTIRENCATVDPTTGHCTSSCAQTTLGLHGRSPPPGNGGGPADQGAIDAVAIDLTDSPGAIVERNEICGTFGQTGVGVRLGGAAAGTIVRGNSITADAATATGIGISLLACNDAAPWIVDNESITGDPVGAATRSAGVNVAGACHPVIDTNTKISTGVDGTPQAAFGVFCGADAMVASRCFVSGNKLIQGSQTTTPAQTFAVSCDAGGCTRISGNTLLGSGGATVVGLSLQGTGALVDRNTITGGCGSMTTTALLAEDAFARLENNVLQGATCSAAATTPEADGLRVHVAASGNEMDVDSNTIDAGGTGPCQGVAAGIGLGSAAGPQTPHGIFRNNILRSGACSIGRIDFIETEAGVTPRLFENNDLDPTGPPTSLYLRPVGQAASPMTAAAVNMLLGASGNISADPLFVGTSDYHLTAGSPCINAGTPVGAPKIDFDGKARGDKPDIGAFQH
jgi:hypothetical protein